MFLSAQFYLYQGQTAESQMTPLQWEMNCSQSLISNPAQSLGLRIDLYTDCHIT